MANEDNLQSLLELQQNQLNLTFSDSDSIDTKALAILAINVALLLFIAQASLPLHDWRQTVILYTPLLLSLVMDGFAIWPRKYIGAAVALDKYPEYLTMSKQALLLQLLSDTQLAIQVDAEFNHQRWQFCLGSLILTGCGLIVLFAIL